MPVLVCMLVCKMQDKHNSTHAKKANCTLNYVTVCTPSSHRSHRYQKSAIFEKNVCCMQARLSWSNEEWLADGWSITCVMKLACVQKKCVDFTHMAVFSLYGFDTLLQYISNMNAVPSMAWTDSHLFLLNVWLDSSLYSLCTYWYQSVYLMQSHILCSCFSLDIWIH